MRERVHIKRALHVARVVSIPLVGTEANLERVHSLAVVLNLLVAIFHRVKTIGLVIKADCESRELSVDGNKVRSLDRLDHGLEIVAEVCIEDLHFNQNQNIFL